MAEHYSNKPKGVEMFSNLMLMKFMPKNEEGTRLFKQESAYKRMLARSSEQHLNDEVLNSIRFLTAASRDTVILGNQNQLDMINLDGLAHNFVDTFHYWSLSIDRPIMDVKINRKSNSL